MKDKDAILRAESTYKCKEWLDFQINVLGKSKAQIAKECGVTHSTICYWTGGKKTKQEYIVKNKDIIKRKKKEKYLINKEYFNSKNKKWYKNNRERALNKSKEYNLEHREDKINYLKEYRIKNKDDIRIKRAIKRRETKIKAMNLLGGCKCAVCGDKNLSHLTLDHINNDGNLYRSERGVKNRSASGDKIYNKIVSGKIPEVELKDLRVLCYNHNCARRREYLDLPYEEQSSVQKRMAKLWKEAFDFFGPCHCGISGLKFLTISHIHNDGAERRRNGEGSSSALIRQFRKLSWENSLKEDFCFECFNCNCSRGKVS